MREDHPFFIDMHVHTSRYSECAESLDPLKLESYALNAGLHGVILTEHNAMWCEEEFQELQNTMKSIILYNGIEVTTDERHHLVIVGVNKNTVFWKGIKSKEAISLANEQGGVVILAHPYRSGLPSLDIIKQVDAIEILSTSLSREESELAGHLTSYLGKSAIGCSDAHALLRVGWAYTAFPCRPESSDHFCEMIRDGLGTPVQSKPFIR